MTFSYEPRPPPEASGYFAAKKLIPAFRWGQVWREEHATAFTIAKMVNLELLAHVQASLQDALVKGTPYEAWAKELTPSLQKAGWWGKKEVVNPTTGKAELVQLGSPRRLKTIYSANLSTARTAGQWERAQRTKGVAPYFLYVRSSSVNPRDQHLAWVGTLLHVDHPWWATHMPRNGWGCNCQVRQVTQREFDRLGGERKPAVFPPVAYRRKLDDGSLGPVEMVPGGIDPGWDTNPGLARTTTILDAFARSLAKAQRAGVPEGLARKVADGRAFKTPNEAAAWVSDRINSNYVKADEPSVAVRPVSESLIAGLKDAGIDVTRQAHGLDGDRIRHLWNEHGGDADKRADQTPITKDDILAVPDILESSDVSKLPPQHDQDRRVRFEARAEKDGYAYTVIAEVRKWLIVPVTMWKKLMKK